MCPVMPRWAGIFHSCSINGRNQDFMEILIDKSRFLRTLDLSLATSLRAMLHIGVLKPNITEPAHSVLIHYLLAILNEQSLTQS